MKLLLKVFIKKLVKTVAKELPIAEDKLKVIWEEYHDEIFEKVMEAIKNLLIKLVAKITK